MVNNDLKGVGPFILAGIEMQQLPASRYKFSIMKSTFYLSVGFGAAIIFLAGHFQLRAQSADLFPEAGRICRRRGRSGCVKIR